MPAHGKEMTPLHHWISLWPTAPLFGVPWRFQKMFPALAWFNPVDTFARMNAAGLAEAVKASEEMAAAVVHAQDDAAAAVAEMADHAAEILEAQECAASAPDVAAQAATDAPADEGEGMSEIAQQAPAVLYDLPPEQPDDLKLIKGVGPKMEGMLNAMGIYRFDQIANFSEANLRWVDENLTSFKGRPLRDDWVAQAQDLL